MNHIVERYKKGSDTEKGEITQKIRNVYADSRSPSTPSVSSGFVSSHVNVPDYMKDKVITRVFPFRLMASMEDLQHQPSMLLVGPEQDNHKIFQSRSKYSTSATERRLEPSGDLSQVALVGARIVRQKNSFPIPLNVSIVEGDSMREYKILNGRYRELDGDNQKMHFSIPHFSDAAFGPGDGILASTSEGIHSSFLKDHKGLTTRESLLKSMTPISLGGDEELYMMKNDHPVYLIAQKLDDFDKPVPLQSKTALVGYSIKKEDAEFIVDRLSDDLGDVLPVFNIRDIKLKFSRPGVSDDNLANVTSDMVDDKEILLANQIANSLRLTHPESEIQIPTITNTKYGAEVHLELSYVFF